MTSYKAKQNVIQLVLVLAFTGFFTGKTPQYVSGLSPFFSAVSQVEEGVFHKAKEMSWPTIIVFGKKYV
jgi:hypothetical protein